ncbi:hypothetical protein ALC62_06771 [Cyphomyrmex costatus]|uniref:Uncharacterized protein n=1 Tax=Cyphomyrmex costatus TaxID=456900 RepID=A0A195CNU7_9HYME|nr:hypothetical protein ALC62_06771 [Cyphomyrmex costatus]
MLHICLKRFQLFSEISQLFCKRPFFHKGLQLRSALTFPIKRSYIAISIRDSEGSFLLSLFPLLLSVVAAIVVFVLGSTSDIGGGDVCLGVNSELNGTSGITRSSSLTMTGLFITNAPTLMVSLIYVTRIAGSLCSGKTLRLQVSNTILSPSTVFREISMHRGTAELTISPHNALLASADTSGNSFIARLNYNIRYESIYLIFLLNPSN